LLSNTGYGLSLIVALIETHSDLLNEAQPSELANLELYSALSSLPKRLDAVGDDADDDDNKTKVLPVRQIKRNKNRDAVQQKLRAREAAAIGGDDEPEREMKRSRSDGTSAVGAEME
jgi:hypothetical protein